MDNLMQDRFHVLGLMSGTSLDGLDICLLEIPIQDFSNLKLKEFAVYPMPPELKSSCLLEMNPETSSVSALTELNCALALWMADAVNQFITQNQLSGKIDLIGSHGQTLFHQPPKNDLPGATLQLSSGSWLAQKTGITCCFNFRMSDMAWGGQGAPLVPYLDQILFFAPDKRRILQNIGGMANLTYLASDSPVIAFDTGPGNALIDGWMQTVFQKPFDENGQMASQGQCIPELLHEFLSDPFFDHPPPRSTGRERFGSQFIKDLENLSSKRGYAPIDVLNTLTQFTAQSICNSYTEFLPQDIDEVLMSGGGVHNQYLLSLLNEQVSAKIISLDELGFNPDAKEAMAFAVLALACFKGEKSGLQAVTGAQNSVCLGEIAPGNNWRELMRKMSQFYFNE